MLYTTIHFGAAPPLPASRWSDCQKGKTGSWIKQQPEASTPRSCKLKTLFQKFLDIHCIPSKLHRFVVLPAHPVPFHSHPISFANRQKLVPPAAASSRNSINISVNIHDAVLASCCPSMLYCCCCCFLIRKCRCSRTRGTRFYCSLILHYISFIYLLSPG